MIEDRLKTLSDPTYLDFKAGLVPNIDRKRVLGVRSKELRILAKDIFKSNDYQKFLKDLPHKFLEEDQVHAFIIENFKDFDKACQAIDDFLPFVDNWMVTDGLNPKTFSKNREALFENVKVWLASKKTYILRYGLVIARLYFIDTKHLNFLNEFIANIKSHEYYVNMARAWYFQEALAKFYEESIWLLEKGVLDDFTHRMTIQKCVDSRKFSSQEKDKLKTFRRRKSK